MGFRKNKDRSRRVIRSLASNKDSSAFAAPLGPTSTVVPQDISEDEVPAGTVPEILSWVNEDPFRAQNALDKELESDKPRKGLVSALSDLINAEAQNNAEEESDSDL